MRSLNKTSKFKKDYRRVSRTPQHRDIEIRLPAILNLLVTDTELPERYADHPLKGKRKGQRDCHIKPDLVLIYEKVGDDLLILCELGSHSEIL
jgi:mRNA interferase YafQ